MRSDCVRAFLLSMYTKFFISFLHDSENGGKKFAKRITLVKIKLSKKSEKIGHLIEHKTRN